MKKFKIADMIIEIDYDERYIYEEMELFRYTGERAADIFWTIKEGEIPQLPDEIEWITINSFRIGVYQDRIYAHYPNSEAYRIPYIVYENNYHKATYYLPQGLEYENSRENEETLQEYLFLFHQEAFFLAVLQHGGISIHSASIIYKDKGIVFSASSQTGKSTHTNLWNRMYGTEILDGDVTICRIIQGKAVIYGLPWAGTSGLHLNQQVELKAIVFLQQSAKNYVHRIAMLEAFQRLFARSFTPVWNAELTNCRIKVTEDILKCMKYVYVLECKPEEEAVHVIKDEIDHI